MERPQLMDRDFNKHSAINGVWLEQLRKYALDLEAKLDAEKANINGLNDALETAILLSVNAEKKVMELAALNDKLYETTKIYQPFVKLNEPPTSIIPGMTLRDWFAGMAMPGIIGKCDLYQEHSLGHICNIANSIADAMIAARGGNDGEE